MPMLITVLQRGDNSSNTVYTIRHHISDILFLLQTIFSLYFSSVPMILKKGNNNPDK